MLMRLVVASVAFAGLTAALPAAAQTPSHAKPAATTKHSAKAHKAKVIMPAVPMGKVLVQNKRSATLLDLSITPLKGKGKGKGQGQPVTIAHDLATDQKAVAPLPKKQGCLFSISGHFDDDATVDLASQNLCTDGAITLVE